MILSMLAAAVVSGEPDVAGLRWIAGTWSQPKDGGVVTEMWSPPQDGAMAGLTLTTRPGRAPVTEFAKITLEPAGITYTALVGGQPPTPFVLVAGGEGEAVFENKTHDFPQRVIYRRCGADLCAAIEGEVGGKLRRQEWRYVRAK